MIMVKCGFSRFVSDSCGQSIASSECISLSQCTRDIKPHLKGFNVIDVSIKSESQLLWARAGTDSNLLSYFFNFYVPPASSYTSCFQEKASLFK